MSLTSFIANHCLAYLLHSESDHLQQQRPRQKTPLRPPWAAPSNLFQSRCTGCGDCAAICPQHILTLEKNGLPLVDFSTSFCTFCGECARNCPTQALAFDLNTPPWQVRAVVDEHCLLANRVLCRSCADQCPQGAIVFPLQEARLPEINLDICTGCGACASGCPVSALSFTYQEAP